MVMDYLTRGIAGIASSGPWMGLRAISLQAADPPASVLTLARGGRKPLAHFGEYRVVAGERRGLDVRRCVAQ